MMASKERSPKVAIVHDYLTQRGGAERVVLALAEAFPDAPIYTSLYLPTGTYDEFGELDVRASGLNRIPLLRRRHRLGLPFLAATFSGMHINADAVVCSSSGWAHGAQVTGRKIVYCYSPSRWLYQTDRYLGPKMTAGRIVLESMRGPLERWDMKAAHSADRYIAVSGVVRDRIRDTYGIDAEVVYPPTDIDADALADPTPGVEPGFYLCVSRLLPYKNVGSVIGAFEESPLRRLVVIGSGPQSADLKQSASSNVTFVHNVSDAELRWFYANCSALVSASFEDFGLTPIEAAAFGKPSVVLRGGGFLDTVIDGVTGEFFDRPEPGLIRDALDRAESLEFDEGRLVARAGAFSKASFVEKMRDVVGRELTAS